MATKTQKHPLFGLMAEFETPQALYDAVKASHEEGYSELDAHTPFPVEEICHEVAQHKRSKVSAIVFVGGLVGALTGLFLQAWTMGSFPWLQELTHELIGYQGYPFNIGGRPLFSWPAFIPVTFELTILFGAFSAVIGMFLLNGLPAPYHPVFNVERFERASVDRYFLVIESEDPKFETDSTRAFLEGLGPDAVMDVEW